MKIYLIASGIALANVLLALIFFGAGFYVRGLVEQRPSVSPGDASLAGDIRVANISGDDDPARGPENAPVTIVEFSDFQCPFCKAFLAQTLPLILANYGERIRFVYRDFPIPTIHPQAIQAAEAAQCAFEQGRFWEYHDRLFQNQSTLDASSLKVHAKALGLDGSKFNQCLDSGKYAGEVQKDLEDGRSYGVTGTPTFFINGRKILGAQPYPTFQRVIEEELRKAGVP